MEEELVLISIVFENIRILEVIRHDDKIDSVKKQTLHIDENTC